MRAMSDDADAYFTIKSGPEVELRIKGSKFYGQAFHASDAAEADKSLNTIRKQYRDATHHCWAYRLDPLQRATRFDDDGEPSGSAGKPILQAVEGAGLDNTLVVVTRYFGGTKLGTGGLVRAYGETAALCLSEAEKRQRWFQTVVQVSYDFNDLGALEGVLARHDGSILSVEREYEPVPYLILRIKASRVDGVQSDLVESTAGRVTCVAKQ
jgi:uncharacterized YigZ family protein